MKCSRCKRIFEDKDYKTCYACRNYNKNIGDKINRKYKQGYCSTIDNKTKKCSSCMKCFDLEMFYKHKRYKDGYRNTCKTCHSEKWKAYYRDKYSDVLKKKPKEDPVYRLKQNVKSYIHLQLKNKDKTKESRTGLYIGCSFQELFRYLIFSNKNYGKSEPLHMDHVVPLSLFDLSNKEEVKIAFHWTNIRVITKTENLKKYNKFCMIEYCNHILSVHKYISLNSKNFESLKSNINYVKNKIFCNTSKLREVP